MVCNIYFCFKILVRIGEGEGTVYLQ